MSFEESRECGAAGIFSLAGNLELRPTWCLTSTRLSRDMHMNETLLLFSGLSWLVKGEKLS